MYFDEELQEEFSHDVRPGPRTRYAVCCGAVYGIGFALILIDLYRLELTGPSGGHLAKGGLVDVSKDRDRLVAAGLTSRRSGD